jgi:hypothetical protein
MDRVSLLVRLPVEVAGAVTAAAHDARLSRNEWVIQALLKAVPLDLMEPPSPAEPLKLVKESPVTEQMQEARAKIQALLPHEYRPNPKKVKTCMCGKSEQNPIHKKESK